jgi:hypothetical protein
MLFTSLGDLHIVNINPETIIAAAVSAAIVGWGSSYFAMWQAGIRMGVRMDGLEHSLVAFGTEVVEFRKAVTELTRTVDRQASYVDGLSELWELVRGIERDVAVLKSK